jgi:calcineurin-like phosphoesterase family protein
MKSLFYQPIKFNSKDNNIVFWSDTHFNHRCEHWQVPLWRSRGFSSIEEHNNELIFRWNSKSDYNTVFFHLGDFIFGQDSISNFKSFVNRANFKELYIMPGNHNSGWKQVFESQHQNVWHISSEKRVIFIPNYLEIVVDDQFIVLSHYPILSFNGQNKKGFCLYGHVHGNLIKNEIGKLYSKANTLEVTFEGSPFPVNFDEVKSIMKHKQGVSFDHHLVN